MSKINLYLTIYPDSNKVLGVIVIRGIDRQENDYRLISGMSGVNPLADNREVMRGQIPEYDRRPPTLRSAPDGQLFCHFRIFTSLVTQNIKILFYFNLLQGLRNAFKRCQGHWLVVKRQYYRFFITQHFGSPHKMNDWRRP